MKPDSAASGVRNSWLALATKSARISSTRRSGVRSSRVTSTSRVGGCSAGRRNATGTTIASYQRSSGTRSMNSTRCGTSLAIARRIASSTSGTRSASDTGSPRRSAGATARAGAFARQDLALDVERDHRLRQPGQHRFEQRHLLDVDRCRRSPR